ncbi:hypothetical protein MEQU1_000287 [Malassezia equina]|uniref:Uncharacterized protein n=1 Tax=Malassezia equina TaxID=1381935 RepID=A0AAF0EFX7_9BASI|nr:hypothetical protein MEQU1_000287 [Malassezia equina]
MPHADPGVADVADAVAAADAVDDTPPPMEAMRRPSQAAQAPMYGRWGGGSQQGRSSTPDRGRPSQAHRKSQRPRFTRSAYQPDPNAVRPEDSKPCRTLFVRNVAFEVDMLLLRADFAAFGEIRTWFDIVQRRGMLFVTYYDTRAADNARVHMNQKVYEGRALDVHFSLPKDEDQQQHCDRTKNQGTLFISLLEATQPLTDEALQAKFVEFGDIRSIRTYKDQAHTRFLEYWDSRACVAAHDALQDTEFLGGHLSIKFAWDLATVSLVTDARQRSEAKAAAEARAQAVLAEEPAPLPEAEEPATTTIEPPPIASPAPEVWEQAQKVQQPTWPLVSSPNLDAGVAAASPPPTASATLPTLAPSLLSVQNPRATPTWTVTPRVFSTASCPILRHKTRERRPFTETEDEALKRGFEKHGSHWSRIARDPVFQNQRSSTDIRDRFRNAFPEEYIRAGYKPRVKTTRRDSNKSKDNVVTHHTRTTRSGSVSAKCHGTGRSDDAELTSKISSCSLPADAAKPSNESAAPGAAGLQGVRSLSPASPNHGLVSWVPQNLGPLSMTPTSPAGSSSTVGMSPLSLPEVKSHAAMQWSVSSLGEAWREGALTPHPTSYVWAQPETSMTPTLPARAQSVPFSAPFSEPRTPLELPSNMALAGSFLYPDGSFAQVLSTSPSSMEPESTHVHHGPSTPSASPLCMPLSISPGYSVCEIPSTALDLPVAPLTATEIATPSRPAWPISPGLAVWPFRP